MSPTPIRDPNAPPDPNELRDIPDHQMAPNWVGEAHNQVPPGAPPSPDFPTGVPPEVPEGAAQTLTPQQPPEKTLEKEPEAPKKKVK